MFVSSARRTLTEFVHMTSCTFQSGVQLGHCSVGVYFRFLQTKRPRAWFSESWPKSLSLSVSCSSVSVRVQRNIRTKWKSLQNAIVHSNALCAVQLHDCRRRDKHNARCTCSMYEYALCSACDNVHSEHQPWGTGLFTLQRILNAMHNVVCARRPTDHDRHASRRKCTSGYFFSHSFRTAATCIKHASQRTHSVRPTGERTNYLDVVRNHIFPS